MNGNTWPANLKFAPRLHIIEEIRGSTRLVPHTAQLPDLAKALQREFEAGLMKKVRTNLVWRTEGAKEFCRFIRHQRCSHLWPYPIIRAPDLIAKIGVIQHIIEASPWGGVHSFRLYHDNTFLPEVLFSGQPLRVCSHVFDRFYERVIDGDRDDAMLVNCLWCMPKIVVNVGSGQAIAVTSDPACVFPYRLTSNGYLLVTCLTLNSLKRVTAPQNKVVVTAHYGPAQPIITQYELPPDEMWDCIKVCLQSTKKIKTITANVRKALCMHSWSRIADNIKIATFLAGFTEDSTVGLINQIDGPSWTIFKVAGRKTPSFCYF